MVKGFSDSEVKNDEPSRELKKNKKGIMIPYVIKNC